MGIESQLEQALLELQAIIGHLKAGQKGQGTSSEKAQLAQLKEICEVLEASHRQTSAEEESDLLSSIALLLARAVSMDEVLNTILDGLKRLVPYDAAGIFLIHDGNGEIESQVLRGYELEKLHRVRQKVDEGIIGWAMTHQQVVNTGNVRQFPQYIEARKTTLSELAVPIISGEDIIGCINLESDRLHAFSEKNLHFVRNLASHAAVAVERERTHVELVIARQVEKELQIARRIQVTLLPRKSPTFEGYDIAGMNIPSREIGGDYYDFIQITKDDLGVVIADVAGKGVPAGMIMSGLRAAIRTRVETTFKIPNIMLGVNRFLCDSSNPEVFVTACYGVLNKRKGVFTYSNAGHDWPLLLHRDGSITRLKEGGPLLGVIPDAEYQMTEVILEPGSVLLMYTDGIVEAGGQTGEELGEERVVELLKKMRNEPAIVIVREIDRLAAEWSPGRNESDDRTVIVVKRK